MTTPKSKARRLNFIQIRQLLDWLKGAEKEVQERSLTGLTRLASEVLEFPISTQTVTQMVRDLYPDLKRKITGEEIKVEVLARSVAGMGDDIAKLHDLILALGARLAVVETRLL